MRLALRAIPIALCAVALACSSAPDHEAPLPDGGYLPQSGCSKDNLAAMISNCYVVLNYDYSFRVCAGGIGPAGRFVGDGGYIGGGLKPPMNDPEGLNYSVDICNADDESSFMDCAGAICHKAATYLGTDNASLDIDNIKIGLSTWACYDGTRVAGEDQNCAQVCMNAAQTCMAACPTDTWDDCATCSNACSAKWRSCDQACPRDTAPCDDGKKDGDELDVDCGGTHCTSSCETGQHCKVGMDCINGVCTSGTCAAPTCTDGVQNGFESDVDCGGPECPACKTGQHCYDREDCASSKCAVAANEGTCQ